MRQRHTARSQHYATLKGSRWVADDSEDSVDGGHMESDQPLLEEIPVGVESAGPGYVREETGERVHRSATISWPAFYEEIVEEGQRIELSTLDGRELDTYRIERIIPTNGRKRAELIRLEIEEV